MAYQDQLYFSLHKPFQNPAMLLLSPAHMLRPPAPAPSGHASVPAVGMVFAGTVQKRRYLRTVLWFVMYRYVFGQARACTSKHLSTAGTGEGCPDGADAGGQNRISLSSLTYKPQKNTGTKQQQDICYCLAPAFLFASLGTLLFCFRSFIWLLQTAAHSRNASSM